MKQVNEWKLEIKMMRISINKEKKFEGGKEGAKKERKGDIRQKRRRKAERVRT